MKTTAVTKEWSGKNRWDSHNSTFKIVTMMQNPDGKEIPMTAYSKPLTKPEKYDKIVLLEDIIRRMVKRGYIFGRHQKYNSKTVYMEFYLNGNYLGTPD